MKLINAKGASRYSLQGETGDRKNAQSRLHNSFLRSIQNDTTSAMRKKSPSQSTFDYMASALTGRSFDPKNPKDAAATMAFFLSPALLTVLLAIYSVSFLGSPNLQGCARQWS